MDIKTNIKNLNRYKVFCGLLIGVLCFASYSGLTFIQNQFSLPKGHYLIAMLFLLIPSIFGIVSFYVLKGTYLQKIVYLLFGSLGFLIAFYTYFFNDVSVDSEAQYFSMILSQLGALLYFLGGLYVMVIELMLLGFKILKTRIQNFLYSHSDSA